MTSSRVLTPTPASSHTKRFAVEIQEKCVKVALQEGFKAAGWSLAIASAVVLGAVRAFPSFARSLNVSAKTALIVTPPFGAFFLKGELAMNDCAQQHRYRLRQALQAQTPSRGEASAVSK